MCCLHMGKGHESNINKEEECRWEQINTPHPLTGDADHSFLVIETPPALCTVNSLLLNSLWGKINVLIHDLT